MEKDHLMVDLETLGKGSNAVIIAVGAVLFDRNGTYEEFYRVVDPQSCVDIGMQIDVSTVLWWMQQSDEARAAFKRPGDSIRSVLGALSEFLADETQTPRDELKVWGNGATFDNVILGNAYDRAGLVRPWEFWNDRCYRTVKSLAPDVPMARTGTHHNALDDARDQALHLIRIGVGLGG